MTLVLQRGRKISQTYLIWLGWNKGGDLPLKVCSLTWTNLGIAEKMGGKKRLILNSMRAGLKGWPL